MHHINLSCPCAPGNARFLSESGSNIGEGGRSGNMQDTLTPEYNISTTDITPKLSTTRPTISVDLPGEVFTNMTEDAVGLFYSLYLTGSLFPIAHNSQEDGISIGSPIVGAAVSGKNVVNLESPVVITLPITSVQVTEIYCRDFSYWLIQWYN